MNAMYKIMARSTVEGKSSMALLYKIEDVFLNIILTTKEWTQDNTLRQLWAGVFHTDCWVQVSSEP